MKDMTSFIWKKDIRYLSNVKKCKWLQFEGEPNGEDSRFERAWGHEFSHQDDALVALHRRLPGVVEADDVRVLQALQHLHLLTETLPLCLGQLTGLQRKSDYYESVYVHSSDVKE